MRRILVLTILLCALIANSQPNCEAFKYYGDELKYEACKVAEKRAGRYQFSRKYQEALDESLLIDPTFAYAYRAKSTAYLKSGDFISWMALMNKAVEYNPVEQLDYRGWCRYQFFRDYKGAIEDIERLDSLVNYDIGHSQNGDYHLHIARALCYKGIGQPEKAIEIIEEQMADSSHFIGVYDYLHLGVLYLEQNQPEKALENFELQKVQNDIAENTFYTALAYKKQDDLVKTEEYLAKAKEQYLNRKRMFDTYVQQMDKIFLSDIEKALVSLE